MNNEKHIKLVLKRDDEIVASYTTKAEALKHFRAYLERQLENGDLYELADPRISIDFDDIDSVYLPDVIDQAVANGSIEFSTWSVRIDRDEVKTVFDGLG